ncbi:hypothetical protein ACFWBB_08375 [Streptomyces sp. NPDC060000]|uniref:hypothetical protein n=1 Tax=Streptomyces sp. NPDC060000 TaxID=3347031 RepID=UPI00369A752D
MRVPVGPARGARRRSADGFSRSAGDGSVDRVLGPERPPLAAYVYDGGVLGADDPKAIRLQETELLWSRTTGSTASWGVVAARHGVRTRPNWPDRVLVGFRACGALGRLG